MHYILQQDGLAYLSRDKGGGWDQIALIRYVWPWAKHVTLAHDSYTCKKFSNTHAFPSVSFATSNIIYFSSIYISSKYIDNESSYNNDKSCIF